MKRIASESPLQRLRGLAGMASVCFVLLGSGAPAWGEFGHSQGADHSGLKACPDPATNPDSVRTPCLAIAEFDAVSSKFERAETIRGAGARLRFNYDILPAASALIPNERSYWALAQDPDVVRLVPDRRVHIMAPPGRCEPWPACKNADEPTGDDGASGQTIPAGVARIGADTTTATGAGVIVAILDTGLDSDHPDLGASVLTGVSCLGDTSACVVDGGEDDHGHGTHVGGIVAALDNDIDVVGVAPGARLVSVKVLDSAGSGWSSDIIAGMNWFATWLPAQVSNSNGEYVRGVVNMSLGGPGKCSATDPTEVAAAALNDNGIPVVVAAGNDRSKEISDFIPAGCPSVIAVASTTAQDGRNKCKRLSGDIQADTASYFTTDGEGVVVSAPGATKEDNNCASIQSVGIESLAMGGGTTEKSGTSMAAPHVAGVVALMLEMDETLCPEGVRDILATSADLRDTAPRDHPYITESLDGVLEGIVDANGAMWGSTAKCN